jgi:hypothetical protein
MGRGRRHGIWPWVVLAMMTRRDESEYLFDDDEVKRFDVALASVDGVLRELSAQHRLHLYSHAARGWPGRTLRKRKLFKTYTLEISLNPAYTDTDTGVVSWDIHDV